jgi:hypothetical protein
MRDSVAAGVAFRRNLAPFFGQRAPAAAQGPAEEAMASHGSRTRSPFERGLTRRLDEASGGYQAGSAGCELPLERPQGGPPSARAEFNSASGNPARRPPEDADLRPDALPSRRVGPRLN